MEKQIVLLNGPSSSGKSTLAKALQAMLEKQRGKSYAVVSIDDLMKCSPTETIYEDDVFEISGDLCACVREAMKTASGVIVDHVITSERIFRQFMETLSPYRIRLVHVTCPAEVLRRREQERGDRCPGSAEASAAYLYPKEHYDLTVDTGCASPDEAASRITARLFS